MPYLVVGPDQAQNAPQLRGPLGCSTGSHERENVFLLGVIRGDESPVCLCMRLAPSVQLRLQTTWLGAVVGNPGGQQIVRKGARGGTSRAAKGAVEVGGKAKLSASLVAVGSLPDQWNTYIGGNTPSERGREHCFRACQATVFDGTIRFKRKLAV